MKSLIIFFLINSLITAVWADEPARDIPTASSQSLRCADQFTASEIYVNKVGYGNRVGLAATIIGGFTNPTLAVVGVVILTRGVYKQLTYNDDFIRDLYRYTLNPDTATLVVFEDKLISYLKKKLVIDDEAALKASIYNAIDKLDLSGRLCPNKKILVKRKDFYQRILTALIENGYEPRNEQRRKIEKIQRATYEKYEMEEAAFVELSKATL